MRHPTLSRKTRDLPTSSLTSRSNGSKPHPPSETLPWSLTGDEKEKKSTQGVLKVPQDDVSINGDRQLGSINSWMNKENVVETNNGYYSAFLKGGNPAIFNNLNEPGGCYGK